MYWQYIPKFVNIQRPSYNKISNYIF